MWKQVREVAECIDISSVPGMCLLKRIMVPRVWFCLNWPGYESCFQIMDLWSRNTYVLLNHLVLEEGCWGGSVCSHVQPCYFAMMSFVSSDQLSTFWPEVGNLCARLMGPNIWQRHLYIFWCIITKLPDCQPACWAKSTALFATHWSTDDTPVWWSLHTSVPPPALRKPWLTISHSFSFHLVLHLSFFMMMIE